MKGCTACYDLSFEWPLPTAEGLGLAGQAYADLGMRAVVAPMVADRSFFEAIPGLMEALPPGLQTRAAELRLPPAEATISGMRAALSGWSFDRDQVCPAVAPTIPHHCSDAFIRGCADLAREFDVALHSHVAESKVQAVTGIRVYGMTQTAHLDALGVLGPHFTVAHGVWLDNDDMARLGDHGASVAHNPGSNMRLGGGIADATGDARAAGQSRHRHRWRQLLRQPEHVRGDAAGLVRLKGAGSRMAALADDARGRVGGDRRRRQGARLRRPDRADRPRLQGRYRHARSRPSELAAIERPGQPARPH